MPGEGALRGPPASGFLARERLGHPYVQHHQVQFASLTSGTSGQPPAHPRAPTAVVDQQGLAVAYRRTQPPEVPPPHPGPIHRVRQPGRHRRLTGDVDGSRIYDGRGGPGPTSQQGALTAPGQSGDHHHRPRGIRQPRGNVSRAPQIHQSSRPQCRLLMRSNGVLRRARPDRIAHYSSFDLPDGPRSRDQRSSHSAQGLQSRGGFCSFLLDRGAVPRVLRSAVRSCPDRTRQSLPPARLRTRSTRYPDRHRGWRDRGWQDRGWDRGWQDPGRRGRASGRRTRRGLVHRRAGAPHSRLAVRDAAFRRAAGSLSVPGRSRARAGAGGHAARRTRTRPPRSAVRRRPLRARLP